MKKLLLSTVMMLLLLAGCSSKKQIEQEINTGNYDQAVSNALRQLASKKTAKRKSKFIGILKEGYVKAAERDLDDIAFLKKDNNPQSYIRIYEKYVDLDRRQEAIKPVLPLYVNSKEVKFKFNDYSGDIINAKNKASDYLYKNATTLINSSNKFDVRRGYDDLAYIENMNPNYKDVRQLMQLAHEKGTDFVFVEMRNDTQQIIPNRLEDDLLNFSTYGLNDLWTVYHNTRDAKTKYDFSMLVNLRNINISPEHVKERQISKEKQIVDGWQYLLDENGETVKDSLGNKIKVDKYRTIRCDYYEFKQLKSSLVAGNVEYHDLQTNQMIDAFPIESEFIFEHIYATYRGDKRALANDLLAYLDRRSVQFPSNEQMVYDTGEDLKLQLKEIITGHNFRR